MKNLYLLLLLVFLTSGLTAQAPPKGCAKIVYRYWMVFDTTCDKQIRKIRIKSGNRFAAVSTDKSKQIMYKDSVWGFRNAKELPQRFFEGHVYTLQSISPVYKYARKASKGSRDYFSTTLDGRVYPYEEWQLRKYTDSATYQTLVNQSIKYRREIAIDFTLQNTNYLRNSFFGGGVAIRYYPIKRWATGVAFNAAGGETRDTLGYSIIRPQLSQTRISWINSYDLVQTKRFRFGVSLSNGLAVTQLRDQDQTERRRTRYGDRSFPKLIASSNNFLVEPGIFFLAKLFTIHHAPSMYLTGFGSYPILVGSRQIGNRTIETQPIYGLGIALMGYDKLQFR